MAYRRGSRSRSAGYRRGGGGRRRVSAGSRRYGGYRASARRPAGRRTYGNRGRAQTVRIVLEQPTASPLARPSTMNELLVGHRQADAPRKAVF